MISRWKYLATVSMKRKFNLEQEKQKKLCLWKTETDISSPFKSVTMSHWAKSWNLSVQRRGKLEKRIGIKREERYSFGFQNCPRVTIHRLNRVKEGGGGESGITFVVKKEKFFNPPPLGGGMCSFWKEISEIKLGKKRRGWNSGLIGGEFSPKDYALFFPSPHQWAHLTPFLCSVHAIEHNFSSFHFSIA